MGNSEIRRYRRISLNRPARIVINAVDDYEGRLINISPGNMALVVETNAAVGDAAVIHIQDLDVIEGTVARIFPDGIAVSFLLSKKRRALLTEKLMLLTNPSFAEGLGDRRSAPRHRVAPARTVCRLADGTSLFVKIIDMSVNGVSVDAPRRPPIGTEILVGRRSGVVVRHTPRGFVAVYDQPDEKKEEAPTKKPALRAIQ